MNKLNGFLSLKLLNDIICLSQTTPSLKPVLSATAGSRLGSATPGGLKANGRKPSGGEPNSRLGLTPSLKPNVTPSLKPSVTPSLKPGVTPSLKPNVTPSVKPSVTPSLRPAMGSSAAVSRLQPPSRLEYLA